jgi:acyl dehydratase
VADASVRAEASLSSETVGLEAGPVAHAIDARWLMAYAAALGETAPRYLDARQAGGPAAHPIFPVAYEWPLALALHARLAPDALQRRSVHAAHDLTIHRPPRAGETLLTRARVVALASRRPGAFLVVRYETVDGTGRPVTTTLYGSIYRGVTLTGPDRVEVPWPAPAAPAGELPVLATVAVAANLAHVYTECARIWNPIHTDTAVAEAAGLPGVILHGTATLALAVSRLLALSDADPARVRRVSCRFTGMVRLPSTVTVRARPLAGAPVTLFDALGEDGRAVLSEGALHLDRP